MLAGLQEEAVRLRLCVGRFAERRRDTVTLRRQSVEHAAAAERNTHRQDDHRHLHAGTVAATGLPTSYGWSTVSPCIRKRSTPTAAVRPSRMAQTTRD